MAEPSLNFERMLQKSTDIASKEHEKEHEKEHVEFAEPRSHSSLQHPSRPRRCRLSSTATARRGVCFHRTTKAKFPKKREQ